MPAKTSRSKSAKKRIGRPIFNAIRKPAAPPGHALTQAKPDEKARPAGRKAKHKRRSGDLLGEIEEQQNERCGPYGSRVRLASMSNPDSGFDSRVSAAFVAHARTLLSSEYLPKIERCLEALTDNNLWARANESSNSIGNLLLHLSGNARQWIVSGLGGDQDERQRQSEFDERSIISKGELMRRLKETLTEVDTVLGGLDPLLLLTRYQIQACEVSALEAIFHVVEHFSMHTGQIILLTKMLANSDLAFYDFSTEKPVHTWHKPKSGSE